MSYDFALEQNCSHQVLFEKSAFSLASGHVYFERQPASQQSVSLYINGTQVPQFGLYSYAELPFSRSEPYRIHPGVNDLLYIGIERGIPKFIQLLTGSNIKANELALDLRRKIPELQINVVNKRVVFRSRSQFNGAAFQFPDPRWTDKTSSSPFTSRSLEAFKTLGIVPGRVVTGRKILPGWTLVKDVTSPIETNVAIKLDSVLPNMQPLIQVSYVTIAQNCRRCFGSRIEFDYNVVNGSYETVKDTDLLTQEFDKFLFTRLGSHWKWSWLGSKLMDHIGGKANSTRSLAPAMITLDVTQAYKTYENIKRQQEQNFPFQKISDAEMPNSFDGINVQSMQNDPTTAIVSISIKSRSRTSIPLRRIIGSSNPFYLTDGSGSPPFLPRG